MMGCYGSLVGGYHTVDYHDFVDPSHETNLYHTRPSSHLRLGKSTFEETGKVQRVAEVSWTCLCESGLAINNAHSKKILYQETGMFPSFETF